MADGLADRLRSLLASDVYTEKGRLRADDLLVRERVGHGLAVNRVGDVLARRWGVGGIHMRHPMRPAGKHHDWLT